MRSPENSVPEDSNGALRYIVALIDHVRLGVLPHLNSRRDLPARHYAAASLARCNRLLLAMIELRTAGFPDVVGILLRSILEFWYLGMYFVLAPYEAYENTHAAHAFQLTRLDPALWGDTERILNQMPVKPRQMKWKTISDRIADLLTERGYVAMKEMTDPLYKTLYQGESAMSVHGGAALLMGHFDDVVPARFGTHEIRLEPDDGAIRIHMSAPLVETLARAVCVEFGVSHWEIDRLAVLIAASAPQVKPESE